MKQSLANDKLIQYVDQQLQHFFPDANHHSHEIESLLTNTLERLHYCFRHIKRKYYQQDLNGQLQTQFNHLNSDHYASFLYLLSNEAWRDDAIILAEKLFYLNKALNGLDCFYSVELPDVFMFVHPVGTVLGHAKYSNYFVVYQNVTVGSTLEGIYPTFSEGCVLYAKSSVIGACELDKNVIVGANAMLIDTNVQKNSSIVGQHPNNKVNHLELCVMKTVFNLD